MSKSREIERSIVQIFADHNVVSYTQPWSFFRQERSSGTGFCIRVPKFMQKETEYHSAGDKFILTNAHCVHNSTSISIRRQGVAQLYRAIPENIMYECDLALLKLDTSFYKKAKQKANVKQLIDDFWNSLNPLEIGGLPSKLDSVFVYGYPMGGFNVSITKGVVNRIQVIPYLDVTQSIAIQIDAPINFGNSGGPAVDVNGKVIGIAFAGEDDRITQNMGYIIPTVLLHYFLRSIKAGVPFTGVCNLGIKTQHLSNPILREYMKIKHDETGIMINDVNKFGSAEGILKKMDIITHINDKKIDNNGTVALRDVILEGDPNIGNVDSELLWTGEVVLYISLISIKSPGDILKLRVIRDKKVQEISLKVYPKKFLVPILEYQMKPSYLIVGGLVFIPLSRMAYLEKEIEQEYTAHLVEIVEKQVLSIINEQVIILSQVFINEMTEDYYGNNQILKSLNDVKIVNLEHLHNVVQKELKSSDYLRFEFKDTTRIMVLNCNDIKKKQDKIISENIGDVADYQPSF